MKIYHHLFERIISLENLFSAWDVFRRDKRHRVDVAQFEWNLEENMFALHRALTNRTYVHSPYECFSINDPKQRQIHKAVVRDRVLHHAIFSVLNPLFEPTFIARSFSCRIGHGTHKGVDALGAMARKISRKGARPCFILKCDIRKFFDSVDHAILLRVIEKRIKDENVLWLLRSIVGSYTSNSRERERERDGGKHRSRNGYSHRQFDVAAFCEYLYE